MGDSSAAAIVVAPANPDDPYLSCSNDNRPRDTIADGTFIFGHVAWVNERHQSQSQKFRCLVKTIVDGISV
jgi:hypothetical protein